MITIISLITNFN